MEQSEQWDVIVIGGGQAGLSVGYHLQRAGLRFVILDAAPRIGDAWRNRWDSLRLFTSAPFDGLDGFPFPGSVGEFPTKEQMADYLESYARRFALPVLSGMRAESVGAAPGGYCVQAAGRRFLASQVIVAMSSYQTPHVPGFAAALDPAVVQLHSQEYRRPDQLRPGNVVIVGAGNSGVEIALDLASQHRVAVAGRPTGHLPFAIGGFWARWVLSRLILRLVFHRILSRKTPLGRLVERRTRGHGGPWVRARPAELAAQGVTFSPRVVAVEGRTLQLEGGEVLEADNVIWCTGFRAPFPWIELPIFDERGEPRQQGGVVVDAPGLYFVGLHFLSALSSTMVHGVGRDARRVVACAVRRQRRASPHGFWRALGGTGERLRRAL